MEKVAQADENDVVVPQVDVLAAGGEEVDVHHGLIVAGALGKVGVNLLGGLRMVVVHPVVGVYVLDVGLGVRGDAEGGLGDGVCYLGVGVDVEEDLKEPAAGVLVGQYLTEEEVVHEGELLVPLWPPVAAHDGEGDGLGNVVVVFDFHADASKM